MSVTLPDMYEVNLLPGDFYFGGGSGRITTLLGSCVAITMWHPTRKIGGMCHYLLAERGGNKRLTRGHYADEVIHLFQHEIAKHRTTPWDYEVKVFGGGNMFANLPSKPKGGSVAKDNVESGLRLLKEHGFKIKATDVGGTRHRKVIFDLWSGDVWLSNG